jgi:coenzyme F420 biosynthesis associated uncharacterized protein
VAELRALARYAVDPVRERTGLDAGDAPSAVVVDRPSWLDSNVHGLRMVLDPFLTQSASGQPAVLTEISAQAAAVQMAGVLAFASAKVLGQYEVFTPAGEGRLLLVVPNIVAAERKLEVDHRDFRLWVCLHEETHRVQFGAVAWLRDYMISLIYEFLELSPTSSAQTLERFRAVLAAVLAAVRNVGGPSVMDAVQSPGQRLIFDRVTALMTLLEGHADYVMDDVGPDVVPSVALIRARFQERRGDPGGVDGMVGRVLGLDVKRRQYSEGRRFVSDVIEAVGQAGFNRVWRGPDSLPTRAEILNPTAWTRRVASDLLP